MSYERGRNVCASAPFCVDPPAEGDRFCETHRAALDRVIHGASKPLSNTQPKRATLQAVTDKIIGALHDHEYSAGELADAIGVSQSNGTFQHARSKLVRDGKIVERKSHRKKVYALAQQLEQAA